MRVKGFGILSGLFLFSGELYATVVPDGTTDTQISIDSLNRTVVDIAPADSDRISLNRYDSFDVGSNGLILNNRTAGARTIINEVTGSLPSSIEGEIRITGTKAHLIVANPNGIYVNGASFYNASSLALTTGSVSFQQRTDEFGDTYQNPVVSVYGGNIHIGSAGLSGIINQLELMSRTLTIEGAVTNENESAFASIDIHSGDSTTEFNSKLSIADPSGAWVISTSNPYDATGTIAVDITADASLSASRIAMIVSDTGAGVRSAGSLLATANDFSLTVDGKVEISGDIKSAGQLSVSAADIVSQAREGEQNTIQSQYLSVDISSEADISLESTLISAAASNEGTTPALQISAAGSLTLTSRSHDERAILYSLADADIQAITITNNSSRIITNTGLTINADVFYSQVVIDDFADRGVLTSGNEDGKRLWYTGFLQREAVGYREINFGTPRAGRVASEIIAASGDITINTNLYQGYGADIIANDGSIAITATDFTNESAVVGDAWMSSRCNLGGCDDRGDSDVELLGGSIQASNELNIDATNSLVNRGGTLQAVNQVNLTSTNMRTEGIEVYEVLTRNKGLRGLFLKNDALWVAVDQGGAVIANMGSINLSGSTLTVDGGRVESSSGVEGDYDVVREPTTQELMLRSKIGLQEDFF